MGITTLHTRRFLLLIGLLPLIPEAILNNNPRSTDNSQRVDNHIDTASNITSLRQPIYLVDMTLKPSNNDASLTIKPSYVANSKKNKETLPPIIATVWTENGPQPLEHYVAPALNKHQSTWHRHRHFRPHNYPVNYGYNNISVMPHPQNFQSIHQHHRPGYHSQYYFPSHHPPVSNPVAERPTNIIYNPVGGGANCIPVPEGFEGIPMRKHPFSGTPIHEFLQPLPPPPPPPPVWKPEVRKRQDVVTENPFIALFNKLQKKQWLGVQGIKPNINKPGVNDKLPDGIGNKPEVNHIEVIDVVDTDIVSGIDHDWTVGITNNCETEGLVGNEAEGIVDREAEGIIEVMEM